MQEKDLIVYGEIMDFLGYSQALCQRLQIPSKKGVIAIKANEKYILHIESAEEGSGAYLYAKVCQVPNVGKETLFKKALIANLYGKETAGFIFSLDERTDNLVLHKVINLDVEETIEEMQTLTALLSEWEDLVPRLGFDGG